MEAEPRNHDEESCGQSVEVECRESDQAVQAARSVMHPDYSDPEWRYYHGAWHS